MATDTARGNSSAFCMSQEDDDYVNRMYEDVYVITIPRDGSLSRKEYINRYVAIANEFQENLIKVARKASNLNVLVSFMKAVASRTPPLEMCSDEQDLETFIQRIESSESTIITESVLYTRTISEFSQTVGDFDKVAQDSGTEKEYYLHNFPIVKKSLQWLRVPFHAVEENNIEVVEMCTKTGVRLDIFRNWKGQTLLGHAVVQSKLNYDIINILLKYIGVNIAANNGETPVMTCIQNQLISVNERFALLESLIDAGADVLTRSVQRGTLLHEFIFSLSSEMDAARLSDWKSVIDVLLTKGVDINAVDVFGQSALMCAITIVPPTGVDDTDAYDPKETESINETRRCKTEIVEYLLHKGANLEVVSNNGYTALCVALTSQSVDVVHTIVKHGANVNHLTNTKMSPAYVICSEADWSEEGDIESILFPSLRILLNAGLDINIKGIDDSTVLHFAAANMNHTICEFLINSGADIEAFDYLQRTPLHMSVRYTNIMVIETLIKLGANIEAKDIHGDTPLTHACLHGNTRAVEILIAHGVNCVTVGDLGIQPIHIAAENGDTEMISFFQRMGCDLSTPDASGSTPLHYAASDGNPDTVQYLLSQNISKKCIDSHGLDPLDLALFRGQYIVSTFLADSKTTVKFGRLPPGIFPNRPLRKMNDLNDYVDEIIEPLKSIGEPGVGIGKAILDTPGLGRLRLDQGESNQIYKSIQQLCLEIVERIGELDPFFQCTLMNAGSSCEGVKVGYPNEFDFVCHMKKMNAFVEKVETVDIPEYFQIIMKDSLPPDISRFCVRSNKSLNAGAVLRHFCRLTRIASYDVFKRHHQNIYCGRILLNECSVEFDCSPIPLSNLQGFTVSWRGPMYKHIDVSVDINPVLYTTEWPSNALHSTILLPNIQEEGMYLIPKSCRKNCFDGVEEAIALESDLWRYSTHHVEAIIMQNLPQEARDCYMLCKSFRLEPLTCSIEVNSHEMESAFKSSPGDEPGHMLQYGIHGNYEVHSEEYGGNKVDNGIHEKEIIKDTDAECMTEYVDHFVNGDESRDFVPADQKSGVHNMCDSNNLNHGYGLSVTFLTRHEHDEEENEITAEKCIPSYYLKSIFLQEMESILSKSGTVSDKLLQAIPFRVYDRLRTAMETQYLTTIFFPGQNIYRQPRKAENLAAIIKLRISYINNILRLMRELGFACDS